MDLDAFVLPLAVAGRCFSALAGIPPAILLSHSVAAPPRPRSSDPPPQQHPSAAQRSEAIF
ncbi:hypothetical protein PF006_g25801 [Phytophthora fragariae]|uniref:Uncharacterized protein n=1 Tax=Phytophthora fragariae TaxID=53985 RepID=A0A6A3R2P2_9STRA|nr:hypothetical protein PF006_g25801 [Phytophthora fragariae]